MKEFKSDLFMACGDVLIHGCNCHNTMGAGVALYVKRNYPEAYEEDKRTIRGDKDKLGNYTYVDTTHFFYGTPITIVNAYTQYGFADFKNPVAVDYGAIESVMKQINVLYKGKKIIMPRIGCGLAGGDWEEVKKIIDECLTDCDVEVYYVE